MEQRGFGSVFVDLLDTAGTLAIQDRFGERASEQSEGAAEFANPATVTQPVNPSQFPSGQPRNIANGLSLGPVVLVMGGVVVLGFLLARALR